MDSSQYDIASLDLYVEKEETYGSRYEQYVALRNMVSSGKLLAISECSNLPDMNAMFRDNAVWSFFGLWYAPYLGEYTDNNALVEFYNSERRLPGRTTRLPDDPRFHNRILAEQSVSDADALFFYAKSWETFVSLKMGWNSLFCGKGLTTAV